MTLTGHKLEGTVPIMDGLSASDISRLQAVAISAYENYTAGKK